MKRLFAVTTLLLGSSCAVEGQWAAPVVPSGPGGVAPDFASTTEATAALFPSHSGSPTAALFLPGVKSLGPPAAATKLTLPLATAEPAFPSPQPKFLYGSRDDYRLQLSLGVTWFRFQNSVFNASAVGMKTSVTYFLNDWLGVEGNVSSAFAPQIFDREHVKTLLYGAGPKITRRKKQWEPWLHAIVGGAHEQPQVSVGGKNAFGVQIGGGADYRFNPRISGRLEGDYVRTTFFGQSQNNYEATAGIVLHFF